MFEGKLTKVIANELGISQRTAETYRHPIMQKLQVGSIAELVRLTLEFVTGTGVVAPRLPGKGN